ncbi:salicylate 1-monooxygenase-like protein [Stipitochalara longipes BDJ]|nr:salicylate 1-monooxygenase-like protein [Stipitochalara longipes BDJ]
MASTSRGTKVLIIGAGIAGPILALLLKKKGYNPIVLEKVRELGEAGSGIMLMPNGLKILSLVGLSSAITDAVPNLEAILDHTWEGGEIGGTDLPKEWKSTYGQPACGIKRSVLSLTLKRKLKEEGIPLLEGWKLADINESEDSVTATSSDGRQETGSFLIGCDGIRSATRQILLKQRGVEEPEPIFTGLLQMAGISPTPQALLGKKPAMRNFYGPEKHFITFPSFRTEAGMTGWAITSRSSTPNIETWQSMTDRELAVFKRKLNSEFEGWCEEVRQLVGGAEKVIRYGLYDREALEPENWRSQGGRCVLVGDAAHPTSPHLGQGANQALEDCWWLSVMLPDVERGKELETEGLRVVFEEFAERRQPRTKALVKGARMQGELRVAGGGEDGRNRDEKLRRGWKDEEAVREKYDGLLREPFAC